MNAEHESCEWIEGGLAFNRRSLHCCLIVHHHTGLPFVADYNGGEVPFDALFALREKIRAANRSGVTHHECRGCPHLKKKHWPTPSHAVEIVGIAHYSYCNVKCSYCFLQTQDPASFAAGHKPYSLLPVVRRLIDEGHLAPHAIIDWGGGEPTSYPEFDQLLELLLAHGTTHYLHTNGTRFPKCLPRAADPGRVHVICSVDAGLPQTYKRLKQKDYLERVWAVLGQYASTGAALTLKYIVKEENRGDADLHAFVARAAGLRPRTGIVDFDYDFPDPGPEVTAAMGRLLALARAAGVPTRFGFTGANFAPEHGVAARAEAAFRHEQRRLGGPPQQQQNAKWPRPWLRWLLGRARRPRAVEWLGHDLPAAWFAGGIYRGTGRARNTGPRRWVTGHPEGKNVDLVVELDRATHKILPLPHDVDPGQEVTLEFDVTFPASGPRWQVGLALLEQNVGRLDPAGIGDLVVGVDALPAWAPSPPLMAKECRDDDAAPPARADQPAGVGRRLWHLPVAPRAAQPGD
jgi:hypothetical protein